MRKCGTLPIFLNDVKARRCRMVAMVERMRVIANG
jgi:hypothetical protein